MKADIFTVLAALILTALAGCGQASRRLSPAFYYWQTTFRLSSGERLLLDSMNCRRLYVKFLDIGRDDGGEIRPLSLLEVADTAGLSGRSVVPCVFITNQVFAKAGPGQIGWLAEKTAEALESVGRQFPAVGPEVQFDCDWTASTRAAYFVFLEKVRARLPAGSRLSATIRLHQYKFPDRTGVPPVDRGMLMFYNTGDIDAVGESNSIFRPEEARKYVQGKGMHYPLPLDLALPVFSWGLVYRDDELWKIIPELYPVQLEDTGLFAPGVMYAVRSGTFLSGHYLREGDRIRIEGVTPELLRQAAGIAGEADLTKNGFLGFFHLDSAMVKSFRAGILEEAVKMTEIR